MLKTTDTANGIIVLYEANIYSLETAAKNYQ